MAKSPIQLHDPNEIARMLADRVRSERLRREWKQETLAARSGVSTATLRRFEKTGQTTVTNLLKVCFALGHIDQFAQLLQPPAATSIKELEALASAKRKKRKRGKQ